MNKTVCFDFDGVIHSYKQPWKDSCIIPDPPVNGIDKLLKKLVINDYEIVICSSRCNIEEGKQAIKDWLDKYDLSQYISEITNSKPPALCYVDDRGVTFNGKPEEMYEKIIKFRPWNR